VTLHDCAPEVAVRILRDAVAARRPLAVHLCNAFTLTLAAQDAAYAACLSANPERGHRVNLVDGTPVAWFAQLLTGRPSMGPVRGPTFMRRMLDEPHIRHFLYGGTEDVLARLQDQIARTHPNATVVGAIAPPVKEFDDADVTALSAQLRRSRTDILWVGLGTPKQDHFVERLVAQHDCVAVGIGAAFDFISGEKPEAPQSLQGTGFEWIYRLLSEPKRLWRRYLVGNLQFAWLVAREFTRTRWLCD
jgi:N-acetylglucosaminyldiphosphoundecaprenol N-acetyl-beta-D-mannosaminyltransferase